MRSLGVLIQSGIPRDYFSRALDEAYRRQSGSDQTAPYISAPSNLGIVPPREKVDSSLPKELADVIRKLGMGDAEGIVCGNLGWYHLAPEITRAFAFPLLHPFDALAAEIEMRNPASGTSVGILAQSDVLHSKPLQQELTKRGLRMVSLRRNQARELDRLIAGLRDKVIAPPKSRGTILNLAQILRTAGADEIVIGSVELAAVLTPDELESEFLNLPALHAEAAVRWMLSEELAHQP